MGNYLHELISFYGHFPNETFLGINPLEANGLWENRIQC